MIQIGVREPWFLHLVSGKKKVEGKKASPTWSFLEGIQMPCTILINNEKEGHELEVHEFTLTDVRKYPSVQEYLEAEGLDNCLPGKQTIDEGVQVYLDFSTKEELAKYDFLAIEVKHVKKIN